MTPASRVARRAGQLLGTATLLCLAVACSPATTLPVGAVCTLDEACGSGYCEPDFGVATAISHCRDPDADPDGDGLLNFAERLAHSNPGSADTDGDGIADGVEWGPITAVPRDRDGDGKADLIEHDTADADADCLPDVDDRKDGTVATPAELAAAGCRLGVCALAAAARCEAGVVLCEPPADAGHEPDGETSCDGQDNDCDGLTDEELDGLAGPVCGDQGVCSSGAAARCVGGQWLCNLALLPGWESVEKTCDGRDNDCDGQTDEAPICDDGIPCTIDSCDPNVGCLHAPDHKACQDGNPCTVDACDARLGCQTVPRVGTCDDGNPCTTGESCQGTSCIGGTPTPCEDGSSCTANPCDPAKGCLAVPVSPGSACKPVDACQVIGSCVLGVCQPTQAKNCDDGNPCTLDTCDNTDGSCGHGAVPGPCDDGSACTTDDSCVGKLCIGVALPTCCTEDTDCADDNACSDDRCVGGGCINDVTPMNGLPCDDDNACTAASACAAGSCVATLNIDCDDGEPCTVEFCNGQKGCQKLALGDGASCDDGDVCNGVALCSAGLCVASNVLDCDDDNPCTDDTCDAKAGCVHLHNAVGCDDGNACTQSDACAAGACSGTAVLCNDDQSCTDDACSVQAGCIYSAISGPCDDGDACTQGDACNGAQGCVGSAVDCDDGQPCTADGCDPGTGCSHDGTPLQGRWCDDGDNCTVGETCDAGACVPATAITCDDGNPCTTGSCNPATGQCVTALQNKACVTPTGCASDAVCSNGVCAGKAIKNCCTQTSGCQDDNPCTLDSCDKPTGVCSHLALTGLACSDGSACTVGEKCAAGFCYGGGALTCDDANECTTDACLPSKGCVFSPRDAEPCPDGDACNGVELCDSGACAAATAPDCNDGQSCTIDSCNPSVGCLHQPQVGKACDDGSACTTFDTCTAAGACVGKASTAVGCCAVQADCDDGFACTIDSCGEGARCVHSPRVCDEATGCAVRTCMQGSCQTRQRCESPTLLDAPIEGSGSMPAGWIAESPSGPSVSAWSMAAAGSGLVAGSERALHATLGAGSSHARLPPLRLQKGAYRLELLLLLDGPASCAQSRFDATLGGQSLTKVCGATTGVQALALPFEVTATGEVALGVRYTASAPQDTTRGAFVDAVRVLALPDASCVCSGDGK
ncbi:MAG: hypothetical protein H6747_11685 [Deltaproteobacteria bacterium]|nr:hypothetical protein [Deltaproteobacteria bacterium]